MIDKKDNGPSLGSKIKEGLSVEEIESFARKHLTEVFIILAIIIATISSVFDFFTGSGLSLTLAALTAIISLAFPEQMQKFQKKMVHFFIKQEKTTQIIVGIVRLVIAVFLPFIIFIEVGFLAGIGFHMLGQGAIIQPKEKPKKNPSDEDEHL